MRPCETPHCRVTQVWLTVAVPVACVARDVHLWCACCGAGITLHYLSTLYLLSPGWLPPLHPEDSIVT